MSEELFNGPLETNDFSNDDRLSVGRPSVGASKTMLWSRFKALVSSFTSWGGIGGTLSAQTDLQLALDDKANILYKTKWEYNTKYGRLYNWYAANNANIAPTGCHVPTKAEMDTLVAYLGGDSIAGGKLKAIGTTYWNTPNTGATDTYGLRIMPSGQYYGGEIGWAIIRDYCEIWCSDQYDATDGNSYGIGYNDAGIYYSHDIKTLGKALLIMKTSGIYVPGEVITDYDGNKYDTVQIGTQVFLVGNYKCTHLNDSTPIPEVTDAATWDALTTMAFNNYNDDITNVGFGVRPKLSKKVDIEFIDNYTQTDLSDTIRKSVSGDIHSVAAATSLADADEILGETSIGGAWSKIRIAFSLIKSTLKTYFDSIYAPLGGGGGGKTISKNNTFTPSITFDFDEKYYNKHNQDGIINISLDSNTNGADSYVYVSFLTDTSAINFPIDWVEIRNDYVNDVGIYGLIVFYDGYKYQYTLYRICDYDITKPTLTSATIQNATANQIDLVFSEAVVITTGGWLFETDGAAISITGVTASGTSTPKLTLSRSVLFGEACTISYDSSTGDTIDANGNELDSITDQSVTNNVSVSETDSTLSLPGVTKVGTVYNTNNSPEGWKYANGDETFAGDFQLLWDVTGNYYNATTGQVVGIDNDTNYEGYVNWILSVGAASLTSFTARVGETIQSNPNIGSATRLRLRRVGTTVYFDKYESSTWSNLHTFSGTFNQTVRLKFQGYGWSGGPVSLSNPKYV